MEKCLLIILIGYMFVFVISLMLKKGDKVGIFIMGHPVLHTNPKTTERV